MRNWLRLIKEVAYEFTAFIFFAIIDILIASIDWQRRHVKELVLLIFGLILLFAMLSLVLLFFYIMSLPF